MKRRKFIQAAAALSTVTASQSKGRMNLSRPAVRTPVEVDLADPDAARYFGKSGIELYVRLEEMYPGDAGQLSGATLRIMHSGKDTVLNAEGAAPQRDGSQITHVYGYLDGEELAYAGEANPERHNFLIRLCELYPEIRPKVYSGATLMLFAGANPRLEVCFGGHFLGVLRGRLVTTFLSCVHQRCEDLASA